jgi:hypothetical protein
LIGALSVVLIGDDHDVVMGDGHDVWIGILDTRLTSFGKVVGSIDGDDIRVPHEVRGTPVRP